MAKTILRRSLLVALASFIGLAPMGVGQVPGGGTGPSLLLTDAEDLEALSFVISTLSGLGNAIDLNSLEFRLAVVGAMQKLYKGNILAVDPTVRSGMSTRQIPHYFLHRRGAPCAIPPDQLFLFKSILAGSAITPATVTPGEQVEFLIEVLDQLAEPASPGPLAPLARWFESSGSLVLQCMQISSSGTDFTAKLLFVETSAPSAPVHAFEISARLGRSGFSGWAVK